MRKILFALFIAVIVLSVSCKKSYDAGNSVAKQAANGWWVTFTQGGVDLYGIGTFFLTTYNTSANDDSIWVDDIQHSWGFKCKAKIDYKTLTFNTTNAQNDYYDPSNNFTALTVNIANGKVLPKAGTSKGGNKTDSIYFEANFSDDPSNTYIISGTARTGFIEDDY